MAIQDETAYGQRMVYKNSQFGSDTPWAQAAAAYKAPVTTAPTSGALPASFIPTVTPMVTVDNTDNGLFVGPIPTGTTRTSTGYIPTPVPPAKAAWTKAGTIVTASGEEIDVDANGIAADGSVPVGIKKTASTGGGTKSPTGGSGAGDGGTVSSETAAMDSILAQRLKSYGLEGIDATVAQIRRDYPKISSEDLLTLLKQDPRYNATYLKRFAGNKILMDRGLPTVDDATYLKAEKEYEKIFKAYNTEGLASQSMYATLIGNSMDAVDVSERLQIGYNRLKADPNVEAAFRQYYPGISNGDIVAAMLNPAEMLPALQRKATAAEIGGAALQQGLQASKVRAEELAAYGIDKAMAQSGYTNIARKIPRGELLSQFSNELGINYGQKMAEDIQFKKDVKAQEAEQTLINTEVSRFSKKSGLLGSQALASQRRGAGLI